MTVKKLIKKLQNLPEYLEVVTASDDEGNSFRKVPEGWVSVEKFNSDMDCIHSDDYENYELEELKEFVVIG